MTELGLTDKELQGVEESWAIVRKNLRHHGIQILMALFNAYPDYKDYFSRFKGIAVDELPITASMRAHSSAFMHGISVFIDNLDDKETLVRLIQDNVGRHYGRNIRHEHYKSALGLIPGYLKSQLGDTLTEDATNGWQKILDTLSAVIQETMEYLIQINEGSSVDVLEFEISSSSHA